MSSSLSHGASSAAANLRIRLSRKLGHRKIKAWNIDVADVEQPRDGAPIERLGTFNVIPDKNHYKHVTLNFERTKYWLANGVQPSPIMAKLLGICGILPSVPRGIYPQDNRQIEQRDTIELQWLCRIIFN